jgi:hypothetical protein
MCFWEMYLYTLQNRNENLAIGSRLFLFLKLAQINFIFADNARILYIYKKIVHIPDTRIYINRIGGVMVSVFDSSAIDRGFEAQSDRTKDY